MPKNIPQPVQQEDEAPKEHKRGRQQTPNSGSKKVKNRNHSGQNHGEGS